ncbi:sigma-70 family RNA polymerase sigma factor [Kineococcus sp. GCM10028916]|uniref:sigma-70 family RNA polymerase sigma factor n=1 Tax=Kineococcus sp. GCM10028916 TaxID=3273394 RepID=UPI0036457FC6
MTSTPTRTTVLDERTVDDLVLAHLPLARSLASQYRDRGEPLDDLVQVACLALVKAARRFDPGAGFRFASYATPTITGEIRRHFRDHGWIVRPPRSLQELRLRLLAEDAAPDETLAQRLECTVTEVQAARQASNGYSAVSLDASWEADDTSLADLVRDETDDTATIDDLLSLRRITSDLDDRERRILHLRFYEEATQSEIATVLGVSQMQVSRLLRDLLRRLRGLLDDQVPVREVGATDRRRNGPVGAPAWSRIPSSSSVSTSRAA